MKEITSRASLFSCQPCNIPSCSCKGEIQNLRPNPFQFAPLSTLPVHAHPLRIPQCAAQPPFAARAAPTHAHRRHARNRGKRARPAVRCPGGLGPAAAQPCRIGRRALRRRRRRRRRRGGCGCGCGREITGAHKENLSNN